MKNRIVTAILAIGTMALCSAGPTWAVPITVSNPSFEDPALSSNNCGVGCSFNINTITNWVVSGPDVKGVFHPDSSRFNFPPGLPHGDQTAYNNGGRIEQTLTDTLLNSTTYTLQVDVGARLDGVLFSGYSIHLFAGPNDLTDLLGTATSPIPTAGNFATATITYTSSASDPLAGNQLRIALDSDTQAISPGQVNFDNVRLDATAVPEPASLLLLGAGLAGIGIWRWKSSRS